MGDAPGSRLLRPDDLRGRVSRGKTDWDYYKLIVPPRMRWGLLGVLVGSVLMSLLEIGAILLVQATVTN